MVFMIVLLDTLSVSLSVVVVASVYRCWTLIWRFLRCWKVALTHPLRIVKATPGPVIFHADKTQKKGMGAGSHGARPATPPPQRGPARQPQTRNPAKSGAA